MKLKYTCSVCGAEFDKRKDCAEHELTCSPISVAKTYECKLNALGMRQCSGDCCANCSYFTAFEHTSISDGCCNNPIVLAGMEGYALPDYNAASICNYFERAEKTE